jgi:small GTP-binding protein
MSLDVVELTPSGAGGVSVIGVRGREAFERVRELASTARSDVTAPQLVRLRDGGEELDEAILCVISPAEIELHVHGSPPLVRRLLDRLRATREQSDATREQSDATREPSDATRELSDATRERSDATRERSDVSRAPPELTCTRPVEAIARSRLERAVSDSGARILLDQAEGALRRDLCALAPLDEFERSHAVRVLLERGRIARFALEPVDVVLAGAVNAGKSTLFNLLVGEERVIVSDEEGTTRDAVRERATLGAYPVFLVDTAGRREHRAASDAGELERASQRRALEAARDADLVLWLSRADALETESADAATRASDCAGGDGIERARHGARTTDRTGRFVVVRTQADRIDARHRAALANAVSALREPREARATIHAIFQRAFALPPEPWCRGVGALFDAELSRAAADLPLDADRARWLQAIDVLLGEA